MPRVRRGSEGVDFSFEQLTPVLQFSVGGRPDSIERLETSENLVAVENEDRPL